MKQQLVKELAEELRRKRSALLLDGGNREIAPEINDEREAEIEETAQLDRITTVESHLEERDQRQLQEIETALNRLDEGEYGECQECGEDIGAARLKALPTAVLCIDCAKELEKRNKGRTPGEPRAVDSRAPVDFQEEDA